MKGSLAWGKAMFLHAGGNGYPAVLVWVFIDSGRVIALRSFMGTPEGCGIKYSVKTVGILPNLMKLFCNTLIRGWILYDIIQVAILP